MTCAHSELMQNAGCAGCELDLGDRAEKAEARVAELEQGYRDIEAKDRSSVDLVMFAKTVGVVYRRVMPEFSLRPRDSVCTAPEPRASVDRNSGRAAVDAAIAKAATDGNGLDIYDNGVLSGQIATRRPVEDYDDPRSSNPRHPDRNVHLPGCTLDKDHSGACHSRAPEPEGYEQRASDATSNVDDADHYGTTWATGAPRSNEASANLGGLVVSEHLWTVGDIVQSKHEPWSVGEVAKVETRRGKPWLHVPRIGEQGEPEHFRRLVFADEQRTDKVQGELDPLEARIAKGRAKYANGCTVLSLLDEAGEVAHAVNKYESADRIREELLDVAAVAMRLYFGEIDRGLEINGLVQRRTDGGQPRKTEER